MCVKCIVLFSLICVKLIGLAESDCVLTLKHDMASPQPVYLKSDEFLAPEATSGTITIKSGTAVTAACPGSPAGNNFIILSNTSSKMDAVELVCVSQRTFRVKGWTGDFKDVKCNTPPWFTGELTNTRCYGGHHAARVGYKMNKKFHLLYEACFENATYSTLYVKHQVEPHNVHVQNVRRPNFVEGTLFGKIRMNNVYTLKKQKERFLQILGPGADEKYLTKADALTRGHLAARADFSLEFGQRTSFHLVNVAPQWRRGNQGDWAALESALRQRVSRYGKPVTVYTGGYGVTTLADSRGIHRPVYLASDQNGNDVAPVPMYFYKVVHDSHRRSATAFVSINNPYYDETETGDLTFCDDVCRGNPNFKWLTWRANDRTTSFCCEFGDFNRTIKHLSTLKVDDLFY